MSFLSDCQSGLISCNLKNVYLFFWVYSKLKQRLFHFNICTSRNTQPGSGGSCLYLNKRYANRWSQGSSLCAQGAFSHIWENPWISPPGSRAFILNAIHTTGKEEEKINKNVFAFHVCQWWRCVWLESKSQLKQFQMKKGNVRASRTKMTRNAGSTEETGITHIFFTLYLLSTIKDCVERRAVNEVLKRPFYAFWSLLFPNVLYRF